MTTEEKRKLGASLTRLSPEDLSKALEIVAQNNPSFQATAEEVDLDIDDQVISLPVYFIASVISSSIFQKSYKQKNEIDRTALSWVTAVCQKLI